MAEKYIVSFFDVIGNITFIDGFFLSHVSVFVAAAAEHVFMAVHVKYSDGAEIVASFTLKFFFINDISGENAIDTVRAFFEKTFLQFLSGQNSHAEAAHKLGIRRNKNILIQKHGKSQRHGFIFSHASLQNDMLADCPVADDAIKVIGNNRSDNAGGNIFA